MSSNPRVPFRLFSERAPLQAPDNKPLICHIVVNVEYWPFEQPMNRTLFQRPKGASASPDVPNFCWYEYGLRAGIPRLLKLFDAMKLPVTAAMNAKVIDVYPSVAETIRDAQWQFMGHGMVQKSFDLVENPAAVIKQTLDKLEAFSGHRPKSWLGPGLGETLDTPDHLAAAGVEYIYEWSLDDLPEQMNTKSGTAFAMPYAIELNDVTLFCIEKKEPRVFYESFRDTVEVFEPELKLQPHILTLALHPHIMAQPQRFLYLRRTLDMLRQRSDTIFMTCDEIGKWYKNQTTQAAT